ncbi:MAG TPA: hypothetical protein VG498_21810 [Terriglobales bacterium]|nr:hypothetical protein [Terriglobales bacterium]
MDTIMDCPAATKLTIWAFPLVEVVVPLQSDWRLSDGASGFHTARSFAQAASSFGGEAVAWKANALGISLSAADTGAPPPSWR